MKGGELRGREQVFIVLWKSARSRPESPENQCCVLVIFWPILATRELEMISGPSMIPSDGLITFSRGFRFGDTVTPNPIEGGRVCGSYPAALTRKIKQ